MRRTVAAILLLALAPAAHAPAAHAQTAHAQTAAEAVRVELNEGSRAYREGRDEEAERHFRRALELDPEGKETHRFVARALRRRYRAGVTTPENLAAGERAAAAYWEVLRIDPRDDDAFKAVVTIYTQLKREEQVHLWLARRANDEAVPGEKRAEAFADLAALQWKCANKITELPSSRKTTETPEGVTGAYSMPADGGEYIRASRCVTDGLAFTRRALELDPRSLNALSNETRLLLEATKLAQMEGSLEREAELVRRQQAAQEAFETRREEVRREAAAARAARRAADDDGEDVEDAAGDGDGDEESDDKATAPPAAIAPSPAGPPAEDAAGPFGVPAGVAAPGTQGEPARTKRVVEGGVLNVRAISRPAPVYPPEAKAARAQGTVVVRVVVDEAGRVAEATAVSGHPLLHDASVAAARRTRFPPTLLSGHPVRVTGVVTYNFVLGR